MSNKYQWMPLKDVLRSLPAMDKKGVSKVARGKQASTQTREGFVEAYIATNGSIDGMSKRLTGRNDHETWSDRRNQFISRHLKQMRDADTYSDGWLPNGEPTPRHLGLIAWAYTPSPKKLQKWLQTQPKEWKQYVSNPAEQLSFSFEEYEEEDPVLPQYSKKMMDEIVSAISDFEAGKKTILVGSEQSPKNPSVVEAIKMGFLSVVDFKPHMSGMYLWVLKPTQKAINLIEKRRSIQSQKHEQISLFNNPQKSIVVPIHLISKIGVHEKIGEIKLSDSPSGLRIDTDLHNLPIGYHGTHIHEYGSLLPSKKGSKTIAGGSAGSHYDPENAGYHGSPNGTGHRGDLPRIHVDEYGESKQTLYAPRLTLNEIMNRSIIIHRYGDNYSDTPLQNGGGKERMAGGIISDSCPHCKKNPIVRDSEGRKIPEKYLKGYTGKQREDRIKEIGRRRTEYAKAYKKYGDEQNFPQAVLDKIYRPFSTDSGETNKESPYTKEAHKRGFVGDLEKKAISSSSYYGGIIPVSILKEVYRRGIGAWPTGHRKRATKEQWAYARVNSFLVGGKTFFTADQDLAKMLPENVYNNIIERR